MVPDIRNTFPQDWGMEGARISLSSVSEGGKILIFQTVKGHLDIKH